MSSDQSQTLLSDDVLNQLQVILLRAVLLSQRLPGGDQPIMFPDLSFVLNQTAVILSDDNLVGSVSVAELLKPVRILSRETIEQEAHIHGDLTYLQFRPPELEDNDVWLTLEARIVPQDPDRRALGLSAIRVKFQEVAGRWEVADEPIFFAA